ncbi:hypothetical protein Acor_02350 [Acrocarpospora corrugata]|uniref:Uncharacterized protein n=1 Tax=Acrocarpospora corrugata TaxID=35763 RepID=A0A5M3VNY4_9ACTN|nr:substrate-binding domain-containing protein [Acrocarpospora corrugata]GER98173.1 hypothetical protein Acor_02350 [Acrocarpospora corrugata]
MLNRRRRAGTAARAASSELRDLEPLLDDLRVATGVQLTLDYSGTIDASETIVRGDPAYDLAWLSSNRYLDVRLHEQRPVQATPLSVSIMTSPLVVGVTPDIADRLTADGPDVTWADIADQAAAGRLRFAMGDPRHSGSGQAALVGVATAAAGTGRALRLEDVRCDRLIGFRTGHKAVTDNADEAARQFLAAQGGINGLITNESVLLSPNAARGSRDPLRIIYPADGIVLSDYPLLLLKPEHRPSYDKVVEWLRGERAQRWIMDRTARRPINPAI